MLKAAVYARYSSGLQKATSNDDQIGLCLKAAPGLHCIVLEDHIYADHEVSGTIDQRPAYIRLMNAARAGQFEAILIEAQDRLWRDQGQMHSTLKRLRFWGTKVFSVSTGTDLTDKTGKLMASVVGWKDEIFAEDLRDKTRRGMMGQIKRGFSAGGRAYGYRSEPIHDPTKKDTYGNPLIVGSRRAVNPDEAAVVIRIFKMYAAGLSAKVIARRLNEENVPPPRWRQNARAKRGWTWTTIAGSPKRSFGILNNPIYIGQLVWSRSQKVRDPDTGKRIMRLRPKDDWVCVPAPELRIVPDALWNQVRKQQAGKKRATEERAKGRPLRHMFSGLLRCAVCGGRYVIKSRKYYGCATNLNQGPSVCPNTRLVRRDVLETILMRLIEHEILSPKAIEHLTIRVNEALSRPRASPQDAVKRELDRARQEMENIKSAIKQGLITPTTKAMLEEAEASIARLEAALNASQDRLRNITALPRLIGEYLNRLHRVMGKHPAEARSILQKLIGEVTLKPNHKGLEAILRGNLSGILDLDRYCTIGAGRGI